MGRQKLKRFEENKILNNLFQPTWEDLQAGFFLKGKWRELYFKNENPIVLELGCGKGEYTLGLAEAFPDKNFIGMDLKGSRLWVGCKASVEKGLANTAFIRRHISGIEYLFDKDEADEIWITFPDPHLKERMSNKRLTSPEFLARFSKILKKGGLIHLKTDSPELYSYTMGVIEEHQLELVYHSEDIYKEALLHPVTKFQTYYEKIWLEQGLSIKYICYVPFAADKKSEVGFFERVWDVARQIPAGRVSSYGAIARYLGSTGSARMVGWALNACAHQHPPVPAHRVVNRNGQLTGKFHFGGIEAMQKLLESEGVHIEKDQVKDFSILFWDPALETIE